MLLLASACGSPERRPGGPGPDAGVCTRTNPSEICDNDVDDDCNGAIDCGDGACSGVGGCPSIDGECEAATPTAALALPDGVCGMSEPNISTCTPYVATLNLSGFPDGARLSDPTQLKGVCVTMEHSWIRDFEIRAECPDGKIVVLSAFGGRSGGEVFMGQPNDTDDDQPVPGTGFEYCWKDSATNEPMLPYASAHATQLSQYTLPAGDYRPSSPLAGFLDCPLNGGWKFKVYDLWSIDNGYVFEAKFVFDNRVDCPVIE